MASTTRAATGMAQLKTGGSGAENGDNNETTAFTADQLQQLLIQLLPYNQLQQTADEEGQGGQQQVQAIDHAQQEEEDSEVGRLVIAEEEEEEEQEEQKTASTGAASTAGHSMEPGPSFSCLTSIVATNTNGSSISGAANPPLPSTNGHHQFKQPRPRRKLNQPKKQSDQANSRVQQSSEEAVSKQQKVLKKKKCPNHRYPANPPSTDTTNPTANSPSNAFPSSFGQQLAEVFTAGLQHLSALNASPSTGATGCLPNPLANLSVEELARMVMEQMCKEIGDKAQQILVELAESVPDASQEELFNAAAMAMAGQLGLMGPNQQLLQQQQPPLELYNQFWQAIQLGLAQAMAAAGLDGTKDDSGIVADVEEVQEEPGMDQNHLQQKTLANGHGELQQHQQPEFGLSLEQLQAGDPHQWQILTECLSMAAANGIDQGELLATIFQQQQQQQLELGGDNVNGMGVAQQQHQQKGGTASFPSTSSTSSLNHQRQKPGAKSRRSTAAGSSQHQAHHSPVVSNCNKSATTSSFSSTTGTGGGQAKRPVKRQNPAQQQNPAHQQQNQNPASFTPNFGAPLDQVLLPNVVPLLQHQQQHPSAQSSPASCSSSQSAFSPVPQQQQWEQPAAMAAAAAAMCQLFQQQPAGQEDGQQQQQMLAVQMLSQMLLQQQNSPEQQQIAAAMALLMNQGGGGQQQQQGAFDPAAFPAQLDVPSNLQIPSSIFSALVDPPQQAQQQPQAIVPNPMFGQMLMKTEAKEEEGKQQQQAVQLQNQAFANENNNEGAVAAALAGLDFKALSQAGSIPNALFMLKREPGHHQHEQQQWTLDEGGNRRKKPREGRPRTGSQGAASLVATVPGTGTLTAKSEKSLGALLKQNPEGTERAKELEELEEFANAFKKQRIKHGFTQGDVGVALGKRYGTDFSQTTISRFEALNLSFKNMCKLRPLLEDWLGETERLLTAGATVQDVMEGTALQRVASLMEQQQQLAQMQHQNQQMEQEQQQQYSPDSSISVMDHQLNGTEAMGEQQFGAVSGSTGGGSGPIPPFKKRRKRTNLDSAQKMSLDTFFRMDARPDNARMNEISRVLDLDQDVVRVWFCNRRQKLRKV